MPKTTDTASTRDARVTTLAPLLRRADDAQRASFMALVVDSYALHAVVAAADDDPDSAASSVPPPRLHEIKGPLKFQDMYGNEYDSWWDYIQAATNGEFYDISGIGPGGWDTD